MTDSTTTRSCLLVFLPVFLLSVLGPDGLVGQSSGSIQISEPSAWATSNPRGLTVVERTSVRVSGSVDHPSGIRAVYLNGRKAALQPESGTGARFVGFADVESELSEVIVELEPVSGPSLSRRYPLRVLPTPSGLAVVERTSFTRQRWAVVVGVSDYQDPAIPDLKYADDDARAVYDFLLSPAAGMGGFDEEKVLLLIDEEATYSALRNALFTFLKGPTDDDVVMVYFAGHGTPDPDRLQNLYLLPYDTQLDDVSSTAFPMGDLQDAIQQTFFHHFILLADACHSAAVSGQGATRGLEMNAINKVFLDGLQSSSGGYISFTASEVNQYSQEDSRWGGGHGAFTHYLLQAWKGAADADGDRIVTLGETTEFVRDRVRRDTRNSQIPSISTTAFDRYLPLSAVLSPDELVADSLPVPGAVDPLPVAAPVEPEEANPSVARALFSPGQAALKSFFLPGFGQASTGRTGPGLGFMTGFAGALGIGLLITSTEVACASPNPQSCPPGDVLTEVRSRPYLDIGVGAALAISVIAAWDAHKGAKRANQQAVLRSEMAASMLSVGPRLVAPLWGGISVEWLRVRF
jgi:uncharacterized caspase-like protein